MAAGGAGPDIRRILAALEAAPDRRWQEGDLIAMGFEPSTIRRTFQRLFGMTFLDLARLRRLGAGVQALADGESVINAQLQAGYTSPAAFRAAFARQIGVAPGKFRRDAALRVDWIETEIGAMVAVADATSLHLLEFADRAALPREMQRLFQAADGAIGFGTTPVMDRLRHDLGRYFSGDTADFLTPLSLVGTPFQRRVWQALRQIPAGETRSYGDLARAINHPTAVRAVARANGANTIAILVPCHRVIGANGALTGYGGGLWRKEKLITLERQFAQNRSLPK